MNPNSVLQRDFFYYLLIPIIAIFLFSGSWHLRTRSGYTLDEPHVMGPSWEAAGRKELSLRCGNNFAVGISTCTSYSGVVDSLFLRLASAATGREISLADPELDDPLLQWLLVVKRGLLITVLLTLCWRNLALAFQNKALALFTIFGFCLSPEMLARGFEVSVNAESGTAIFFAFTIFLRNLLRGTPTRDAEAFLLGTLSTIRVPVALFSVLAIRSLRSLFVLIAVYSIWAMGLFRSSYDLVQVLYIFGLRAGGRIGLPEDARTISAIAFYNFKHIAQQYLYLFPLALVGIAYLVRNRIGKWHSIYFGWAALISYLALSAINSQARYFIGFTGIFLCLIALGIVQVDELLRRFSAAKARRALGALSVALFLALNIRQILVPVALFPRTGTAVVALPLAAGEREIFEAAGRGREIFVDRRLRLSLANPLWNPYRSRLHIVDPFNEDPRLLGAGLWVLPCYSPEQLARDFGVQGMEPFKKELERQCKGKHTLEENELIFPNSLRAMPAFGAFSPFDAALPTYELLALPPAELLKHQEVFRPEHPVFHFKSQLAILEVKNPLFPLIPKISKDAEVKMPAAVWRAEGRYGHDWESQYVSRNGEGSDKEGISLSRRIDFATRKVALEVDCGSNFRKPGSELQIVLNGAKAASCDLDTSEATLRELPWARHFGGLVIGWKRKFYPCHCHAELATPLGPAVITVKLVAGDSVGQVRFKEFRIKGL